MNDGNVSTLTALLYPTDPNLKITISTSMRFLEILAKIEPGQGDCGHFVFVDAHVYKRAGLHGSSASLTRVVVNWFRSVEP